jgi:hypothetical protein
VAAVFGMNRFLVVTLQSIGIESVGVDAQPVSAEKPVVETSTSERIQESGLKRKNFFLQQHKILGISKLGIRKER